MTCAAFLALRSAVMRTSSSLSRALTFGQHRLDFIGRKLAGAVFVHVHHFARRYVHAADVHRHVDRMHRHVAVTRRGTAEQVLELHGADGIDVARRAVGQHAHTADRLHRRDHDLARQTYLAGDLGRILLLQNEDGRLRGGVQGVDNVEERQAGEVGIGHAVNTGDRVAHLGAELRIHAADGIVGVPVLGPRVVEAETEVVFRVGRHHIGD